MIVPILNRYDLLENMLSSINYPIDNILIIDNSKQYNDKFFYDKLYKNVRYHIPKKDSGLSASYNFALKTVKSLIVKYLYCC